MTRLLVAGSRLLFTLPSVSLAMVLTAVVLSNLLMAAWLVSPDGFLNPPAGENLGSIFALAWVAGIAIVTVWLACRLVIAVCGQVQEWIGSAISSSIRWR